MSQMEYVDDVDFVKAKMKQFKLVDMRESLVDLVAEADDQQMDRMAFLRYLFEIEDRGKTIRRTERLREKAGFEDIKHLEDIDYSFNPSLDKNKIDELGRLGFIEAKENVLIIGPPGVGKSMIATGIGIKACNAGKKVLFVNAKDLLDKLCEKAESGELMAVLARLDRIELLIVDELSYIKMDKERESLFFQMIRRRYEKGSLVVTTNLPMGRWDELFTGKLAATAILDRLMHHCHILSITGESYRIKGQNKKSVELEEQINGQE